MMDPNHFLMIVLSRFELYHIFSSAECRKRYNRENANKVRSHCCACVCVHAQYCLTCMPLVQLN